MSMLESTTGMSESLLIGGGLPEVVWRHLSWSVQCARLRRVEWYVVCSHNLAYLLSLTYK